MDVTVYSPAGPCGDCMATKLNLRAKPVAVPFREVTADGDTMEKLKADGHAGFPVVVVDMGDGATWSWSKYRHEDIARLKVLFAEELATAA